MKLLFSYLKLTLILITVLVSIQIPGIVDQYGNLLKARYLESNLNAKVFQDDADRYFNGDLNKLLNYYRTQTDPIITSGGQSIESVVRRNRLLKESLARYEHSMISAYLEALIFPADEIAQQLWESYNYQITLDSRAIGFATAATICLLLLFDITVNIICKILIIIFRSHKHAPTA